MPLPSDARLGPYEIVAPLEASLFKRPVGRDELLLNVVVNWTIALR